MGQHLAQNACLDLASYREVGSWGEHAETEEVGLGHTGRGTCSVRGCSTPRSRDPDEGAGCWPFLAQDIKTHSGCWTSCSRGRWRLQGGHSEDSTTQVRVVGPLHLGSTTSLP